MPERPSISWWWAGLSGLAAAYSFRQAKGPHARILVLDNHDDFGGHAKRNEFRHGDRLLIGYGGTEQIYPGPSAIGEEARSLLKEIGRIAIASSDSGPGALTQVAFDQALGAVRELDRT